LPNQSGPSSEQKIAFCRVAEASSSLRTAPRSSRIGGIARTRGHAKRLSRAEVRVRLVVLPVLMVKISTMADDLIVVEGLEKRFRLGLTRKTVHAVQGVSFRVRQGEIFGFLGPNGAGKTTTIKMLTGLIRPTAGSARLFDIPI